MTWIDFYNLLGIKDFIFFISAPQLQDYLFPVKLVFVAFAMFFLAMVIYLMINSTWLQYKFLEDATEFFTWASYGQKELTKQIAKIRKRTESGAEADFKLAIIDADDLLIGVLNSRGYEEKDFASSVEKSGKLLADISDEVINAHAVRNSIVHNPDYKLPSEQGRKILDVYVTAINSIGLS